MIFLLSQKTPGAGQDRDRGTGHCPVCLDVVLDTSKIILLFRVTYLFAIPLVNDFSILYVFQP